MPDAPGSVDAYIVSFPPPTQQLLQELRRRIHAALPDAEERISYQIPTFTVDGQYVIYVAGWARHVSLYPVPEGDAELDADLGPYLSGRGTVKLPLARPVPWDLVDRAIAAQVATRLPQIRP
jgi:uncharacterized protein YdhG (YjbR/CyaY superfamily)